MSPFIILAALDLAAILVFLKSPLGIAIVGVVVFLISQKNPAFGELLKKILSALGVTIAKVGGAELVRVDGPAAASIATLSVGDMDRLDGNEARGGILALRLRAAEVRDATKRSEVLAICDQADAAAEELWKLEAIKAG